MADRDGAAVHVDPAVVERQFEPAQAGQHLRGKSFVNLDHVDIGEAESGAGERLFRSFDGTDPHDPRRHSRNPAADDANERPGAGRVARLAAGDNHRHRAVVDARGVTRGRHTAFLQRPQAR